MGTPLIPLVCFLLAMFVGVRSFSILPPPEDIDPRYGGKDGVCPQLPCYVVGVNDPFNRAPIVRWSKKGFGAIENYLSLTDDYWLYRVYFPSVVECKAAVNPEGYDCGLELPFCLDERYSGSYRCTVTDPEGDEQSMDVLLPERLRDEERIPCYMPEAFNLQAELDDSNSENLTVMLRWEVTDKPEGATQCKGGRMWKARMLKFPNPESVNDHQRIESTEVAFLERTSRDARRETFFGFTEGVDRSTYYLFQVQNIGLENELDLASKQVGLFSSHVYYFGEQVAAHIVTGDDTIILMEGESRTLECTAKGIPKPTVYFLRDQHTVPSLNDEGDDEVTEQHSIAAASYRDDGTYFCYASNILVNPPQGKKIARALTEFTVKVVPRIDITRPTTDCDLYSNAICNAFIYQNVEVLVNNTQGRTEATIRAAFQTIEGWRWASGNEKQFSRCMDAAKAMICHSVFPYCDQASLSQGSAQARPICQHSCQNFKEGGECWGLIQPDSEVYEVVMSNCDTREAPGGDIPECIPVSLDSPGIATREEIVDTGDCYSGKGRGYRGNVGWTRSGQCQAWDSQNPHVHSMTPQMFPSELEGAGHACRNPGGVGDSPWCYSVQGADRWEYCDIKRCGFCAPYSGSFCQNVPGFDSTQIFLDWDRLSASQQEIDGFISGFYLSASTSLADNLTPGCENALRLFLCHGAFPFCSDTGKRQRLCNSFCSLLDEAFLTCPALKTEIERVMHYSFYPLVELECGVEPGGEGDGGECMPEPERLRTTPGTPETKNCYTDFGQTYRGNVSVTASGHACRDWATVNVTMTADRFPELAGAENSCRNPGGLGMQPWCFTSSQTTEYCNISLCDSIPAPGNDTTTQRSTANDTNVVLTITLVIFVIILALMCCVAVPVAVFCVYCHVRKSKELPRHLTRRPASVYKCDAEKMVPNPTYVIINPQLASIVEKFPHYDRSQIQYMKQLGQGNFGVVFQGRATGIVEEGKEMMVAVKTLKSESSSEALSNFVHEAKLMFSFDHPNIVKIYGVCMSEMPYYMIFEFMDKGDLTQFLRGSASSAQRRLMNPFGLRSRTESTLSDDPASLSDLQLVDICKQIASGMVYLAEKNHVHRDLACRNCLVQSDETGSGLTIKISDFGMSHNLYTREYYRVNGQAVLPVRWMSPEAVIYGKFSTAGDVWSFGVVMWEVFTYAMQPYFGISNEAVTDHIRRGKKLHQPPMCPPQVYTIMKYCWSMEPSERPSFADVHKMLRDIRLSESSSIDSSTDDDQVSHCSDISSDAAFEENSVDGLSIAEADIPA